MILTKEKIEKIDLDALIYDLIKEGKVEEFLIIVPTNRRLRKLKKEIISSAPNKSTSKIHIETLSTISTKLLRESKKFNELSEAAAYILLNQSCSAIKLKYFISYKGHIPKGTIERIKDVISLYKKSGISPEVVKSESENLNKSEKLKACDIANIYEDYIERCKRLSALEIGDIYFQLNRLPYKEREDNFRKLFPQVKLIIINGFDEFTPLEIEIINSLSNNTGSRLFLNFDYYLYNPQIFSHLDECYSKLENKGFKKVLDLSESPGSLFRDFVRENLFVDLKRKSNKSFQQKIFKIGAPDRIREIESLAKEIKKLILFDKVKSHTICVAFNLIKNYSHTVRDIFTAYEIPFNLTDRIALDSSLPVTAIVNFLEILENNFYYKNIFRALSSGFINLGGVDVFNLSNAAVKLRIVVGSDVWFNRLKEEISREDIYDEDDTSDYKSGIDFKKALQDFQKITDFLKPFNSKLTIREFLSNLEKLFLSLSIPHKLLGLKTDRQEEYIKAVSTFLETVTEVFGLLENELGENAKFNLSFYLDQIRVAGSRARFNVKEKSDYGVQVTTLNEIRGLKFDYLFIGGLCDGDFPTKYSPEIFFSGSFRKKELIHITEERYLFYQALCAWNKRLYLTYPQTENEKELIESSFLTDFSNVFDLFVINYELYDEGLFSFDDFLINFNEIEINSQSGEFNKYKQLLDLNFEKLDDNIKVHNQKINNPFEVSIFNGFIITDYTKQDKKNPQSKEAIEKLKSFSQQIYSISRLETYAKCPFKYFAERVLNLKKLEEPSEDVEPVELGSILHSILFHFFTKLREENISLPGCSVKDFKRAEKILFEIAKDLINKAGFNFPPAFYEKERILGLGGNKGESILYKILEIERSSDSSFIPGYFEVSFGGSKYNEYDKYLSTDIPIELGDIKLRGKIDRLEIDPETNQFNVVDYKLSGQKPTKDELYNGLSLQLPFYLYVAEQLLKSKSIDRTESKNKNMIKIKSNMTPAGMYIYSLKYKEKQLGKSKVRLSNSKLAESEEIELIIKLIETTKDYIKKYIDNISNGKFNLSLLEDRETKVCKYCDYRSVCRIDELI